MFNFVRDSNYQNICERVCIYKKLRAWRKKIVVMSNALVGIGIFLVVTGCSLFSDTPDEEQKLNVFEHRENPLVYPSQTYTVSAASLNDIDALNDATDAAVKYCDRDQLDAKVLKHMTVYQGVTDAEKDIVIAANNLFDKSTPTESARDHRVTIKFVCLERVKKPL